MIQEIKDQILINFGREAKSDEISDMLDISLQKNPRVRSFTKTNGERILGTN